MSETPLHPRLMLAPSRKPMGLEEEGPLSRQAESVKTLGSCCLPPPLKLLGHGEEGCLAYTLTVGKGQFSGWRHFLLRVNEPLSASRTPSSGHSRESIAV